MQHTGKKLVSGSYLAGIFDCTPQWISKLVQKGMPKAARNQYPVAECLVWYTRYLKKAVEQRDGFSDVAQELKRERTRKVRAEADRAELELSKARGEVIPIEVYEREIIQAVMSARQSFLSLAGRIAPQLEGESRSVIKSKLDQAIRGVLAGLARSLEAGDVESNGRADGAQTKEGEYA